MLWRLRDRKLSRQVARLRARLPVRGESGQASGCAEHKLAVLARARHEEGAPISTERNQ